MPKPPPPPFTSINRLPSSIPPSSLTTSLHKYTSSLEKLLTPICCNSRLPESGVTGTDARRALEDLLRLDSTSRPRNVGAGEREGRISSSVIKSRIGVPRHGVGRSGNLAEYQPKAIGTTLCGEMVGVMVTDALRVYGLEVKEGDMVGVMPVATGMCVMMCLLSISADFREMEGRDDGDGAGGRNNQKRRDVVIWCRCDQKSVMKSITTAGFNLVVVTTKIAGDAVVTDVEDLEGKVKLYSGRVVCVVSTTSCFAPRIPDDVVSVGKVCKDADVPHVVNCAYGLYEPGIIKNVNEGRRRCRVDYVVGSADKNFMVPVGGSVVLGREKDVKVRGPRARRRRGCFLGF